MFPEAHLAVNALVDAEPYSLVIAYVYQTGPSGRAA
jgi:DNA topoisomerase VI subunit A